METLRRLAVELDDVAATLSAVAYAVTASDPPQAAFGADAPGRLGEVGRALHGGWSGATAFRAREALAAAARIEAIAAAVREAANAYAEADHVAVRRENCAYVEPDHTAARRRVEEA